MWTPKLHGPGIVMISIVVIWLVLHELSKTQRGTSSSASPMFFGSSLCATAEGDHPMEVLPPGNGRNTETDPKRRCCTCDLSKSHIPRNVLLLLQAQHHLSEAEKQTLKDMNKGLSVREFRGRFACHTLKHRTKHRKLRIPHSGFSGRLESSGPADKVMSTSWCDPPKSTRM